MSTFSDRIAQLLIKRLDGIETLAESLELDEWLIESPDHVHLLNSYLDEKIFCKKLFKFDSFDPAQGLELLCAKVPELRLSHFSES